MEPTPTADLVKLYLAGEQSAAAELLDRFGLMAYAVVSHLLYNRSDVDDVYQEACVRTFSSLKNLRDPSRFAAWLRRIAIRTAVDYIRDQRTFPLPLDEQLIDPAPGPETQLAEQAARDQVRAAINRLPEHYRQVVVLFYWSDCSYQEIAETLSIPVGTVMSRMHKARTMLGRLLGPDQNRNGE